MNFKVAGYFPRAHLLSWFSRGNDGFTFDSWFPTLSCFYCGMSHCIFLPFEHLHAHFTNEVFQNCFNETEFNKCNFFFFFCIMLSKTWSVHETFLVATWALTNVWHVYPPVLHYPVTAWQAVFSYEIARLFCTARGSSSSTSRTLGRTQFLFLRYVLFSCYMW